MTNFGILSCFKREVSGGQRLVRMVFGGFQRQFLTSKCQKWFLSTIVTKRQNLWCHCGKLLIKWCSVFMIQIILKNVLVFYNSREHLLVTTLKNSPGGQPSHLIESNIDLSGWQLHSPLIWSQLRDPSTVPHGLHSQGWQKGKLKNPSCDGEFLLK